LRALPDWGATTRSRGGGGGVPLGHPSASPRQQRRRTVRSALWWHFARGWSSSWCHPRKRGGRRFLPRPEGWGGRAPFMMSLTEQVRERAYARGFDLVRVTTAEPLLEAEAALKERIGAGYFTGMDWFTAARAEVAANPRALLPTARSVLSLGTFYLTDA